MTDPSDFAIHRLAPASGGDAHQLVVLLHGLGADGRDLLALGGEARSFLPDAEFVAPDAPEPCDMAPMGRQWFSLRSHALDAMTQGARRAAPLLDAFLDRLLAQRGLPPSRMALVGFSQGTMMALHTALRRKQPVAAVVGFSGMLLGAGDLQAEIRSRPPVLLVHGEEDQVVPFGAMAAAGQALRSAGVEVETMARPRLGHWVDAEGLARSVAFLRTHLAGSAE